MQLPAMPLLDALGDGLAALDADDTLQPCNAAMRELFAAWRLPERAAPIAALPLSAAEAGELHEGGTVLVERAPAHELRLVTAEDRRWLVARDVSWRERALAAEGGAARARAFAATASLVAHDLSNLLGSVFGIVDVVRPRLEDPEDVRLLDEMVAGTRHASRLTKGIVRLLQASPRRRVATPLERVVDEVLALVGKQAERAGVRIEPRRERPLLVRVVAEDLAQALLHVAHFCLGAGAQRVGVVEQRTDVPSPGGRTRPAAVVRFELDACAPPVLAAIQHTVAGDLADRRSLANACDTELGLVQGLAALRRAGGDVVVTADPPSIALLLPLAREGENWSRTDAKV